MNGSGYHYIMPTPNEVLASIGITLPMPATPLAAYVPAVRVGDFVFTAGQLPLVDGRMVKQGKVGNEVSPEEARDLARTCAINALAAINSIAELSLISRVIKVVGFVASDPDFTGQSAVVDGASELLGDVFGEIGRHARSAVGVAALPRNAPVEVELVVEIAGAK